MSAAPDAEIEHRVLIFAPIGRDAELTRDLLARASIPALVCRSISTLAEMLATTGAGVLLLTEEALDQEDFPTLVAALARQPPWSDIPVLLFAGGPETDIAGAALRSIDTLRNITLLERPVRMAAVLSTVRAALRGRARQYEVRALLQALDRARSEAETANRLKDEFLATLSHELRTPLNAILGWTSMLARGLIEPTRLPRVFEALDRNAQSQAQLIGDVLDVSRIITGKLQLQPSVVDLCDIVARATDAVRPAAVAKNIRVTLQEPPGCFVHGDSDRLQQVFWNLLSNAIKFTPNGGSIHVEITRDGNILTVAVIDSGVGIPSEFAPFVFDRFRQADQTITRVHGGLGLGLSIVRHLTELHGGTVTASSAGRGQGARFEVRLPAVEPTTRFPEPVTRRPVTDTADFNGQLILIVDDDESTREVVAAALEAAHARVEMAASAAEARQRLQQSVPALIIADLGMPTEDGFSLIRGIRESGKRDVPVIALSAYVDQASREAALAAGFNAFLAKPAPVHALLELVGRLLHERPTRRGHGA
jgi:signal transduction histidine kinase/ActR/RegA family two-component response regulator